MTKEETLGFIAYLKSLGEKISIESRVECHRTLFNRRIYDPFIGDVKKVREMCMGQMTPLEIYESIASGKAKTNPNWKILPGFGSVYVEDVADYLAEYGYEEKEAMRIAKSASIKNFNSADYRDDERMPAEFRIWANSCLCPLESREYITQLFTAEYIGFLHKDRVSADTDYTVTDVSTEGAYNFYGYEKARTESVGRKHLVLNFENKNIVTASLENDEGSTGKSPRITVGLHSLHSDIAREKMIAIAKLICDASGIPEVWLNDLDTPGKVTVVKKNAEADPMAHD